MRKLLAALSCMVAAAALLLGPLNPARMPHRTPGGLWFAMRYDHASDRLATLSELGAYLDRDHGGLLHDLGDPSVLDVLADRLLETSDAVERNAILLFLARRASNQHHLHARGPELAPLAMEMLRHVEPNSLDAIRLIRLIEACRRGEQLGKDGLTWGTAWEPPLSREATSAYLQWWDSAESWAAAQTTDPLAGTQLKWEAP